MALDACLTCRFAAYNGMRLDLPAGPAGLAADATAGRATISLPVLNHC
jgi:hypothetical protein